MSDDIDPHRLLSNREHSFRFDMLDPVEAPVAEIPPRLDAALRRIEREAEEQRARARAAERRAQRRHALGIAGRIAWYLFILGVGALVMAWVLDRGVPTNARIDVLTPTVEPGQDLRLRVTLQVIRACQVDVVFDVFDGQSGVHSVDLGWRWPSYGVGSVAPYVRPIRIPITAVPGSSYLRVNRQYRCPYNPLHQLWPINDVSPDIPFRIVDSSHHADGDSPYAAPASGIESDPEPR